MALRCGARSRAPGRPRCRVRPCARRDVVRRPCAGRGRRTRGADRSPVPRRGARRGDAGGPPARGRRVGAGGVGRCGIAGSRRRPRVVRRRRRSSREERHVCRVESRRPCGALSRRVRRRLSRAERARVLRLSSLRLCPCPCPCPCLCSRLRPRACSLPPRRSPRTSRTRTTPRVVQVRGVGLVVASRYRRHSHQARSTRSFAPTADERDALRRARLLRRPPRTAKASAQRRVPARLRSGARLRESRCASATTSQSTARSTCKGRGTPTPTSSSPRSSTEHPRPRRTLRPAPGRCGHRRERVLRPRSRGPWNATQDDVRLVQPSPRRRSHGSRGRRRETASRRSPFARPTDSARTARASRPR